MTISFISLLIIFKISVSLILVCLPFLAMTKARLEQITETAAVSDTFFRLYGIAILALLVGYATAFPLIQVGQFPWGVAIMGVISNGGASFILLRGGSKTAKRVFVPIFGAIFAGLLVSLALPEFAITPIF